MNDQVDNRKERSCKSFVKKIVSVGLASTVIVAGMVCVEHISNGSLKYDEVQRSKYCLGTGTYPHDSLPGIAKFPDQSSSEATMQCLNSRPQSMWLDLLENNEMQVRNHMRRRMYTYADSCLQENSNQDKQLAELKCVNYAVEKIESDLQFFANINPLSYLFTEETNKKD